MNVIESCDMTSPNNRTEECSKLIIDDTLHAYVLSDVMVAGREYTFSCWLMGENAKEVVMGTKLFPAVSKWMYYVHTFTATTTDLILGFTGVGTYYIYHPQLEIGNKATDWTTAPEDTDARVTSTETNVLEANGTANEAKNLATDTEERVSSVESEIDSLGTDVEKAKETAKDAKDIATNNEKRVDSAESSIDKIVERVDTLEPLRKYIDINLDGTKPYIMELGAESSDFRLRLTNTNISFMEGSFIAAYISNARLHIDTAVIESELQIGSFVWTERANGNVGLIWRKGGI